VISDPESSNGGVNWTMSLSLFLLLLIHSVQFATALLCYVISYLKVWAW
jgi:hypothetical protein